MLREIRHGYWWNRVGNMNVKAQIVIEAEPGEPPITQEVAQFQRETLQPATLGLALVEAKTILQDVQQALVKQQGSEYLAQQAICDHCGGERACKERRGIVYRTWQAEPSRQPLALLPLSIPPNKEF